MLLKNALIISSDISYNNNENDIQNNHNAEICQNTMDIRIEESVITDISRQITPNSKEQVIDLNGLIVTPGLVDMHCHLREPGFEGKETIKTGIESAINGGYTAICPMGNTNPAADNSRVLKYIINRAKEVSEIGFFPICAVTKGLDGEKIVNVSELKENGAIAFSDDGKPIKNMQVLREALKYVNSQNCIIISHSEDSSLASNGVINEGKVSVILGLKGIPDIAESAAIARELEIVRNTNGRYHFAHVSTKRSIELIRQAKKEGLKVTAETAPHYFSLTEDDIKGYESKYKVNPPLRTQEDCEAVIQGLLDGTIDVIATDHAPHTLEQKQSPIQTAPMGIAGFETALGVTLTYLVHTKKLTLIDAINKLTLAPSKILGLKNQGRIEVGKEANLTVIDLNEEWIVNASKFKSKCKISPYDGLKLKGKAKYTIIKGKIYKIG